MSNIILIGMPGAGKSTVGVLLAKELGMQFIDTDLLLQSRGGDRLSGLIERMGAEGFLDFEAEVAGSLACENTVVATGGSVVLRESAMAHLCRIGRCIYLKEECAVLERRAGEIAGRGVVFAPGQTFASIYEQRRPLYERYAHITVEGAGNQRKTVEAIKKQLE